MKTATTDKGVRNVLMAMTYADRIRQAGTPQEALAIVGEGLDELLAREVVPEPTGWDAWSAQPTAAPSSQPVTPLEPSDLAIVRAERIARQQELLAETSDPEERRALEARIRLLEDDGKPREPDVPEGRRIIVTEDGASTTIDIPPPSAMVENDRRNWARDIGLPGMLQKLEERDALAAYAKGGPMWLYYYDRNLVMQMPPSWRRALVDDVEQDSPAQAHELARDILKDTEPGTLGQSAVANL